MKIAHSCFLYISLGLLLSLNYSARAQDLFGDDIAEAADTEDVIGNEEPADNDGEQPEDQKARDEKIIDELFEELEEMLSGKDQLSISAKEIKSELKSEYQRNQRTLHQPKNAPADELEKIQDRQKVIIQYAVELDSRVNSHDRPFGENSPMRQIQSRLSKFHRQNPRIRRENKDFQRRESELMRKAMMGRRGFRGPHAGKSMSEIEREFSLDDLPELVSRRERLQSHPGEQAGAIQDRRSAIRNLLRLKWKGNQLTLDRDHWDTAFAGKTVSDIREDVDHLLQKKGAPTSRIDEDENAARMAFMRQRHNDQANVERLFAELNQAGIGSSSRSSGNGQVKMAFDDGNIQARIDSRNDKFQFQILESAGPGRLMRVVDSPQGLLVMLVGDMVHRFHQSKNGEVRLVEILDDDEVVTIKAASFAELYRDHPQVVERRLIPLLDHVGIVPPASRFDRQIVDRLIERLAIDVNGIRKEVMALVEDLDGNKFTKREAASEQLRVNLDQYYEFLVPLQDETSLSREARARIRKLLIEKPRATAELDVAISAMQLTSNREYLSEVKEIVGDDQATAIDRRIKEIAAESNGATEGGN